MKKTDTKTNFLGFKITSTSSAQLLKKLSRHIKEGMTLKTVFTPNPEQLVHARSHSSFAKVLGKADYLLPDGIGIVIGSKLLSLFKRSKSSSNLGVELGKKPGGNQSKSLSGSQSKYLDRSLSSNSGNYSDRSLSKNLNKTQPILERITGVDVVAGLLNKLEDKRFLVIGGRGYDNLTYKNWKVVRVKPGLNNQDFQNKITPSLAKIKKVSSLKSKKQSQKNIYWSEAFLNVTVPTSSENEALTQYIKKLKPDVVFVALGAPYQEEWIIKNKELLEANGVRLAMVVGGAFDMLLNKVQRAPKLVQRIGLEWLFRLYKEPWRWRRQVGLFRFVKIVVGELVG